MVGSGLLVKVGAVDGCCSVVAVDGGIVPALDVPFCSSSGEQALANRTSRQRNAIDITRQGTILDRITRLLISFQPFSQIIRQPTPKSKALSIILTI